MQLLFKKLYALNVEEMFCKYRIVFHFLMLSTFMILLFLSYYLDYNATGVESLFMSLRITAINALIFYLFFYVFLPFISNWSWKSVIVIILISIPLILILWLSLNYLIAVVYYNFDFEVNSGELKGVIAKSVSERFLDAVSFKRMVSRAVIIIFLLSPFFLIKIVTDFFRSSFQMFHLEKYNSELKIQNINIEKDFLKSQLNPHFLFNTLNNLYGLTVKKDDRAPETVLNLSEIMSYTLYNSNSDKVTLINEIDFLENYFSLEKMRYPQAKEIEMEIIGREKASALQIAPLLTFIFLENAFKYGLKNSTKAFLNCEIKVEGNQFFFYCENDFEENYNENKLGGIGLENTQKRLQLIYPDRHDLKIEKNGGLFKVSLQIILN